ncbi:MAG TPA: alpha/beta hydrolase [Usitatibacter sp.]|nr:alpha/beta hydrolase [Usitatibacter sp.]
MSRSALRTVRTPLLDVAYESTGPENAPAVVMLHGYPYDARAFDGVVEAIASKGLRTLVPYLRGYGATRFLSAETMRSGEQAAVGQDLKDFLDALALDHAILAGFDWGARAACIVAALWPERVRGLVTCGGYQVQDLANAAKPAEPEQEQRYWYQYYFHTERGRAGLEANRRELCRLLWRLWSPTWQFDEATFGRTAASFDNPDWVDVVVHSYRHRHGNAPGDARYGAINATLAAMPRIGVPTVVLHGADDGVIPASASEGHERYFDGRYERRVLAGVGHNPPQEAPAAFADAVLDVHAG